MKGKSSVAMRSFDLLEGFPAFAGMVSLMMFFTSASLWYFYGSPIRKQSQRTRRKNGFSGLVRCWFFSIKNRSKRYIAYSDVAQKEGFEL